MVKGSVPFIPWRTCSEHASLTLEEVEIGEGQLIGTEIVQETTKQISQIKDLLKAAHDHQKSYADKHRKPLEFNEGDHLCGN
nr:reverse transcriptase domain-containing protein [Tanacetum cinerariifolium]